MYSVPLRPAGDKTVHVCRKTLMKRFNRNPILAPKHINLHSMKRRYALLHKCPKVSLSIPDKYFKAHIQRGEGIYCGHFWEFSV